MRCLFFVVFFFWLLSRSQTSFEQCSVTVDGWSLMPLVEAEPPPPPPVFEKWTALMGRRPYSSTHIFSLALIHTHAKLLLSHSPTDLCPRNRLPPWKESPPWMSCGLFRPLGRWMHCFINQLDATSSKKKKKKSQKLEGDWLAALSVTNQ